MVQWLRIYPAMQGMWVQSLGRELRSLKLGGEPPSPKEGENPLSLEVDGARNRGTGGMDRKSGPWQKEG